MVECNRVGSLCTQSIEFRLGALETGFRPLQLLACPGMQHQGGITLSPFRGRFRLGLWTEQCQDLTERWVQVFEATFVRHLEACAPANRDGYGEQKTKMI